MEVDVDAFLSSPKGENEDDDDDDDGVVEMKVVGGNA